VAARCVQSVEGRGQVIAIDLLDMEPVAGVDFMQLDFMAPEAPDRLKALLRDGQADAVLSDMAAQGTGHARTDHLRIIGLAEAAAEFALSVLAPGGTFVCKLFQGGTERELLDKLKRAFKALKHVKPPASRAESAEVYLVATGFRGE
jgi:23S rRNA (uridine2552-2'-O)-methyltransferase